MASSVLQAFLCALVRSLCQACPSCVWGTGDLVEGLAMDFRCVTPESAVDWSILHREMQML